MEVTIALKKHLFSADSGDGLGSLVVPESPRWLALRGRKDDAVESLRTLQSLDVQTATSKVDEMLAMSSSDLVTTEGSNLNLDIAMIL